MLLELHGGGGGGVKRAEKSGRAYIALEWPLMMENPTLNEIHFPLNWLQNVCLSITMSCD